MTRKRAETMAEAIREVSEAVEGLKRMLWETVSPLAEWLADHPAAILVLWTIAFILITVAFFTDSVEVWPMKK